MATSDFLLVVAKPCWQMGKRVNLQWLQLQPLIHSSNPFEINRLIHPPSVVQIFGRNIQDEKMIRTLQKQFIGCSAKNTIKIRGSHYHLAFEFRFPLFLLTHGHRVVAPLGFPDIQGRKSCLVQKGQSSWSSEMTGDSGENPACFLKQSNNRTCKDLGAIFRSD